MGGDVEEKEAKEMKRRGCAIVVYKWEGVKERDVYQPERRGG